jgi:carbonic anhydrase
MLTFTDDGFKRSIQDETGIKPAWAAEAFPDLDEDVHQSIARIKASPFIPHEDQIRGGTASGSGATCPGRRPAQRKVLPTN